MIRRPFNLQAWIDEHRHELKPPVANRNLYHDAGDYIVMIEPAQMPEGLSL
jgi:3-hydroxyanthranilate 3,4-dioxygenase